jgi:hypothetical protein
MELQQATRKFKFENATTYYFENNKELIAQLIVTKQKSGYDVEYNNYNNDFFRHTDGLKNLEQVKKYIQEFKVN